MLSLRTRFSTLSSLPRDARLLLVMTTLFGFGYGGIGLMLRPLYVLRLDQGTAYYGLYSALGSLAFMAASLGAGWLGMRIGARQTMVWGAIGCLIGSAIMPFTEFFPTSLWQELPIASNLLLSAAWALVSVNTIPALVGVTGQQDHDRAIGVSTMLNALGVLLGNLIGGVLPRVYSRLLGSSMITNDGFRLAISTALPFGLAMIVLLLRLPEQPPEHGVALLSAAPHSLTPFLVIGVFSLFIPATSSAIGTFATPYFFEDLHLSTEIIGVVTTLSQGLAVLGTAATPWLARRLTSRRGDILVSYGMALTLVPMALVPNWIAAVLSRIISNALFNIRAPLTQMYAMAQVRQADRPMMSAIIMTGAGLCGTIFSYLGGLLAASHGYRAVFWAGATITGVSTALYALVTRLLIAKGRMQRA